MELELINNIYNELWTLKLQGQYHLGLGNSYEGGEPTGPNNATPADSWDTTPLQEEYKFTPFNNNTNDSPNTPVSVSQYYLQQVINIT